MFFNSKAEVFSETYKEYSRLPLIQQFLLDFIELIIVFTSMICYHKRTHNKVSGKKVYGTEFKRNQIQSPLLKDMNDIGLNSSSNNLS